MHYYRFHVGDYAARTKYLSPMADLAYRRMLDLYYTTERPLPLDIEKIARAIGLADHLSEVSMVVSDFFLKSENGHVNQRCDEEIAGYHAKADNAKRANLSRWQRKKSDSVSDPLLKSDPNQINDQILTNNQEPITIHRSDDLCSASRDTNTPRGEVLPLDPPGLRTDPAAWQRLVGQDVQWIAAVLPEIEAQADENHDYTKERKAWNARVRAQLLKYARNRGRYDAGGGRKPNLADNLRATVQTLAQEFYDEASPEDRAEFEREMKSARGGTLLCLPSAKA